MSLAAIPVLKPLLKPSMLLKKTHRIVGLTLSLIMLSISLTGVALVWKKEYLWLSIDGAGESIDRSLLADTIDDIEAQYADDEVTFIQVHSEGLAIHKVFLKGREYAWHNQGGKQLQRWSGNERWEDWLLDWHHRFFLGNTIGLNIAGFGGLLLMPLLIIGVIIWWPRRRLLKLGLFPRSLERGAIMRSHSNIGSVFLLPIMLLAISGVVLVYPVEARWTILNSFSNGEPPTVEVMNIDSSLSAASWNELFTFSESHYPGSTIRWVSPASKKYPVRAIGVQRANTWSWDGVSSIRFLQAAAVEIKDSTTQNTSHKALDFSYPFHAAKLGLWFRLFITMVGLAMASICLLGLVSYISSKRSS